VQPLRRDVGRGEPRDHADPLARRSGRLLTWSLAAAGANDFLQAGFAAVTQKANELEQRVA